MCLASVLKAALCVGFYHPHAAGPSFSRVADQCAPLRTDAGRMIPVGSKGAALGVDAQCASRLLTSVALWASGAALLAAPVLGPVVAKVVHSGPIEAGGHRACPSRGPLVQSAMQVHRAMKSRYSGLAGPDGGDLCISEKCAPTEGEPCSG